MFVANTDWYLFNFRLNLIQSSAQSGWQTELACPQREHAGQLSNLGLPVQHVPFDTQGLNPAAELRALLALARAIRQVDPDVIHLFTLKCVLYGCLVTSIGRRRRVIGAITGMGHLFTTHSRRNRLLKPLVLWGMKIALRRSGARLIFQNSADRDEFVHHGLIPSDRTVVIRGSGVDCERFTSATRQSGPAEDPPTLLFCGRLLKEKGIAEYLAATQALREAGFKFQSVIAGAPYPGNPSSLTEAEVASLKKNQHHSYLGHVDDTAQLFAKVDIVVLPTYREGTPKSLLEAAASGCIIVTTDIPGCVGIVDPGINGHLVPVKTVAPLVEALKKLITASPAERAAMGIHSRHIAVENFSDVEVNRKTIALYEK